MSDRWCDDCSWPYECAAAHACHRAERGERRAAAPAEVADSIADEIGWRPVCFVGALGALRILPECADGQSCVSAGACDAQMECQRDRRIARDLQCSPPIITGYGTLSPQQAAAFFSGATEE